MRAWFSVSLLVVILFWWLTKKVEWVADKDENNNPLKRVIFNPEKRTSKNSALKASSPRGSVGNSSQKPKSLSPGLNHHPTRPPSFDPSLMAKQREDALMKEMASLESPIQEMVDGYLLLPEAILVERLRPVLEKAILGKRKVSQLPYYQRSKLAANVSSRTLLQAAVMIEDRPLYEEARDLMAQVELEGYRRQKNDPYLSTSQVGRLVPTPRMVGLAIERLYGNPILQAKVRKVISYAELARIDCAMEQTSHLHKNEDMVKWVGFNPRVIETKP